MDRKIVLGKRECIFIIVNVLCAKIFLNFPRKAAEDVGTAGWMLMIYISVIALLFYFIITKLYKGFHQMDLLDIGEGLAGNIGRIFVGILSITFFIYITSVVLREFAENMKTVTFVNSPISFILGLFIISMVIGAYLGLEAIAWIHIFIVPVIFVGYITLVAGIIPQTDFTNLLPLFGTGYKDIFLNGIPKISILSELLLIFFLVPYIKLDKNFKTIGYTAIITSSIFLISSSMIYISSTPYPIALESFLPIFQISRVISFGRFFQRIESLYLVIWASSGLLYLTTNFYFITHIFKKSFRLKYQRPLVIPFAVIIFCLSLIPQNLTTAVTMEVDYFRSYSWMIAFLFVLVLLIAAVIKKRYKERGKLEKNN